MDVSEFSYVWTTQKRDYVLVKSEYGYAIVNKRERTMLCIISCATMASETGACGEAG